MICNTTAITQSTTAATPINQPINQSATAATPINQPINQSATAATPINQPISHQSTTAATPINTAIQGKTKYHTTTSTARKHGCFQGDKEYILGVLRKKRRENRI